MVSERLALAEPLHLVQELKDREVDVGHLLANYERLIGEERRELGCILVEVCVELGSISSFEGVGAVLRVQVVVDS